MDYRFDGIAFDLDGTLYPNYRLNIRIIPFILKEFPLLLALGEARSRMRFGREDGPTGDGFYEYQARIMAEILGEESGAVRARTEKLIYRGWEPLFTRIAPFPHVRETLEILKERGFKLGLLSDFPPEMKLANMGLAGYWDTVLCSEMTGRIKPHPLPFLELAKRLEVAPERLLYVGNSVPYDIVGAKNVGMKAALVTHSPIKRRKRPGNADFAFSDYRQLSRYVVG
jgi:putative hydrolase of the HAD superfamily